MSKIKKIKQWSKEHDDEIFVVVLNVVMLAAYGAMGVALVKANNRNMRIHRATLAESTLRALVNENAQ